MAGRTPSIVVLSLLVVFSLLCSCSDDEGTSQPTDTTPPAAVSDLIVQGIGSTSVTLRWSAPGDDGSTGQATSYDLRFMQGGAGGFAWESATAASGLPAPQAAGTIQSFTVENLTTGTTYTFGLKAADEKSNWSVLSNLVSAEPGGGSSSCQVVPTNLDFGSIPVGSSLDLSFTLTNNGTLPLAGTVSEACDPFSIVAGGGAYSLAASESRTVTVRYAPTAAGSHTCTVDTGGGVCANVSCVGTGTGTASGCVVTPSALMFPLTPVGSFTVMQFVISNEGTGNLSGSVSESCSDFQIMSGSGSYTLSPGQDLTVIVRYAPTSEGSHTCTIETGAAECADVPCSGTAGSIPGDCRVNPSSLLFPDTEIGSTLDLDFTLSNDGDQTIVGTISSSCAMFSVIDGGGAYSLAPGQSRTGTVRYAPTTHGTHTCVIETGLPCIDIPCAGTSVQVNPTCWIYPLVILDFAPRYVGTWEEKVFNIQNLGSGTLTGTVGSACPPFAIVAGAGSYSLAAGQIHRVTVRFAPTSAGSFNCEIDTGTACTNVGCIGTAVAAEGPSCSIQPSQLAFSDTAVGSHRDLSFTITNSGGGTLEGNAQESCGSYSIVSGGGSFQLGAGQVRTVTVRFEPTATGLQQCSIDLGTACADVACSGVGTGGSPDCSLNPSSLAFPPTAIGEEADLSFDITNSGAGTLTGVVSESCEHYEIVSNGGAFSLAQGQTRTVTVRFAPQAEGALACSIALGSPCGSLGCTGTGISAETEEMVLVPAGAFTMGSDDGEGGVSEMPEHAPYLSAYYIDKYEVTNQRYAEGLNWAKTHGLIVVADYTEPNGVVFGAPGSNEDPYLYMDAQSDDDNQCRITWNGFSFGVEPGWENHPVVFVTWWGAAAYCNWRSSAAGRTPCYNTTTWTCSFAVNGYRLPTEAEWEKAARGSNDERTYPWGEGIDCDRCNYSPDVNLCVTRTAAVDDARYADDLSPYGVWQMAGNVWEWCNDWSDDHYYEVSPATDPTGPAPSGYRVSRGGSWWDGEYYARCAARGWDDPINTFDRLGFRTVRR